MGVRGNLFDTHGGVTSNCHDGLLKTKSNEGNAFIPCSTFARGLHPSLTGLEVKE